MNWLNVQLVAAELILCIGEDLTRCLYFGESRVHITRYDGSVINKIREPASMFGQDDLLLGALDDGSGVDIVGLLELLASHVGKLSIGDQALCFSTDKLLLECD